ncbi:MAG: oxygen-dependent coproporphyrinogen oxidase [Halobacteriovoraceae bacterium]|nr:oxygen-dependent coproporphyrinogen oxidase [Halobacteriovoraceae bacterium]MCB9093537.1 oxygen-dependent coproporphyrinogen oxidase [Halobacteriovoraceae bacterium]
MNNLETFKKRFAKHVKDLQNQITAAMQEIDGDLKLREDSWTRKDFVGNPGGGGITKAFTGGVFENAGVNTSEVFGKIDPEFAARLQGKSDELWATGISLILHPVNPKIPTVHANFRMIQQGAKHWFGGGMDLTPFFPIEEDFIYFHQVLKEACDPYDCYEWMKKECDQYFVNHHRDGEMRGIGGIFYDHQNSGNLEEDFEKYVNISNHFIKSYFPIVKKRLSEKWTADDEQFQLWRRGRYVEFNLLHDRGTLFGLKTKGRVDSILISLPARCRFEYGFQAPAGSPYQKMMEYYWPQDWINK